MQRMIFDVFYAKFPWQCQVGVKTFDKVLKAWTYGVVVRITIASDSLQKMICKKGLECSPVLRETITPIFYREIWAGMY